MARGRYIPPERPPWGKRRIGLCVALILLAELALMALAIGYNATSDVVTTMATVALFLVGLGSSLWLSGAPPLRVVAALTPLLVVYFSGKATGDFVMQARGEIVVAHVAKVDTSKDRNGTNYHYELAQPDGTAIPDYLGNYSGPVLKVGQSITVLVDPGAFAMPRPPGTMNPTWWLIFDTVSMTLLTGALVLGVRGRAQAHDAPDAILRKT